MLFATALDHIDEFVESTPRSRVDGLLKRIRSGQSLEAALILEAVRSSDLATIMEIAQQPTLSNDPTILGELIEAAYRRRAGRQADPEVVWTGPRLDPALKYSKTAVAVRSLVEEARASIVIAGYHVSSETLDSIGLWAAIERGVHVLMLLDANDAKAVDREIILAKGVELHTVASVRSDYAKFHVKALVADACRALVGSANFTLLGHSTNIELGVLLGGAAAWNLEAVLRSYVRIAAANGWVVSK